MSAPRHEQPTADAGRDRARTRDSDRLARADQLGGLRVGRWELLGEIARGGMGAVYRARDSESGQEAALKVMVNAEKGDRLRRFEREIAAVARLQHPAIVGALDHGVASGRPYLAMELIHGETLLQRLDRGPLPPREAAELALTLAGALRYAHDEGVLHRDLKPDNVLIHPGLGAMLTDFGLTRDLEGELSRLTRSGVGLGTPGYWAPEQAVGSQEVGPRSDVYGLGATLYAALTGHGPHATDQGLHAIMVATLTQAAKPTGVDSELDRIVLRCLEKTPDARYPSMGALEAALSDYLLGGTEPARRPRWVLGVVAVALLAVGGALAAGIPWWRERQAQAQEAADEAAAKELGKQALAAYRAGRFDEAADLYARSLERRPGKATPHYNRGMCLMAAGRDDEAIEAFEASLAIYRDGLRAWLAMGEAHNRNGRPEQGLACFEEVLRIEPDHAQAFVGKGSALFDLERFSEAEESYTRAIANDSSLVYGWGGRGATREQRGDVPGALGDYVQAAELDPKDAGWISDRSRMQFRLRMGAEAAAGFSRVMELAGESAGMLYRRGQARLLPPLSDLDGAIDDFERALALTPLDDPSIETIRRQLEAAQQVRANR